MSISPAICQQFPLLVNEEVTYLDSAATTQKPRTVLDALLHTYEHDYANVHRGGHYLGDRATTKFEQARKKVSEFLGASSPREIVCTKNATESLNLVARSLGETLESGDTIYITRMEHHSNMIPWIQLAERKNLQLKYWNITENRELDMDQLNEIISDAPKIVALPHVSNVLGTVNPVAEICAKLSKNNIVSVIDGCQAPAHFPVNVSDIGCDFYACSSHKMYGPSGVGILYGKLDLLKQMPPFLGGGEMIREAFWDHFDANSVPHKFEAGTMPISEFIALGAAIDFLTELGMDVVEQHSEKITQLCLQKLSEIPEVKIYSHPQARNLVSFCVEGVNNHDLSDYLSDQKICIRVGHHCAQPLTESLGVKSTTRASFGVYTTPEEIEVFAEAVKSSISDLT